jgi:dienelactone hydrolase
MLLTALLAMLLVPASAFAQLQLEGPLPDLIDDDEWEVLASFFEYERRDLSVRPVIFCTAVGQCTETEDRGEYVREKFVFEGREGTMVPGYLGLPSHRDGPHPIVILQYGFNGRMENWWDSRHPNHVLTESLLQAGFGVLTLEQPFHGDRKYEIGFSDPPSLLLSGQLSRLRDMSIQAVIDVRQTVDFLGSRSDLDGSRIASVGFSQGAMHTIFLAAVDPRIRAAVSWATPMRKSDPLFYPGNFARRIVDAGVLMLGGERDPFYSAEEVETVLGLVPSTDKRLIMFDGAHQLRPREVTIVVGWLRDHLRGGARP